MTCGYNSYDSYDQSSQIPANIQNQNQHRQSNYGRNGYAENSYGENNYGQNNYRPNVQFEQNDRSASKGKLSS